MVRSALRVDALVNVAGSIGYGGPSIHSHVHKDHVLDVSVVQTNAADSYRFRLVSRNSYRVGKRCADRERVQ